MALPAPSALRKLACCHKQARWLSSFEIQALVRLLHRDAASKRSEGTNDTTLGVENGRRGGKVYLAAFLAACEGSCRLFHDVNVANTNVSNTECKCLMMSQRWRSVSLSCAQSCCIRCLRHGDTFAMPNIRLLKKHSGGCKTACSTSAGRCCCRHTLRGFLLHVYTLVVAGPGPANDDIMVAPAKAQTDAVLPICCAQPERCQKTRWSGL